MLLDYRVPVKIIYPYTAALEYVKLALPRMGRRVQLDHLTTTTHNAMLT